MEDAVEAIKMAFAVLVFVIALSVSFSMFSKAKTTADSIATIQDTQKYLESSEAEREGLYIDSTKISGGGYTARRIQENGYRIVKEDDVYSTIYRYSLEKYGVTIMKMDGTIITRFDSNTENLMRQWDAMEYTAGEDGTVIGKNKADKMKQEYTDEIRKNIATSLVRENTLRSKLTPAVLASLYQVTNSGNGSQHGAPWTSSTEETYRRINIEINGGTYQNGTSSERYTVPANKSLKQILKNRTIIEIVNEIDNSEYIKDTEPTDLLQTYKMPTIEVVYIIQ